jgi:hypothetical protein
MRVCLHCSLHVKTAMALAKNTRTKNRIPVGCSKFALCFLFFVLVNANYITAAVCLAGTDSEPARLLRVNMGQWLGINHAIFFN